MAQKVGPGYLSLTRRYFFPWRSLDEGFSGKIFPFLENKSLAHVSGKDRQALSVFSSNKTSVSKNLNLTESSNSIDADVEKFVLSFFGHVLLSS